MYHPWAHIEGSASIVSLSVWRTVGVFSRCCCDEELFRTSGVPQISVAIKYTYKIMKDTFICMRVYRVIMKFDIRVGKFFLFPFWGCESRWGRDFRHSSRPSLGSTQPPVQWVPSLSRGLIGRGVVLTPTTIFSAEVLNWVELYLCLP